MYAGYRVLKCGDYGFSPEHPPLAKIVAATPLLMDSVHVDCTPDGRYEAKTGLDWLYSQNWQKMLAQARTAVSIFAFGLVILVWFSARRMFGLATAIVATILITFEPNFLAHGGLVTTDTAVAFAMLLAIYAFYLWMEKRSVVQMIFTGLAIGICLLSKHSGVAVVPILCMLAVLDPYVQQYYRRPRWKTALRNLRALVLMGLVSYVVLWAGYSFRYSARPNGQRLPPLVVDKTAIGQVVSALRVVHIFPEAYVEGIERARVLADSQLSPMFILGRVHSRTRWYFFPVNMIIRYTVATLVLLVISTFGWKLLGRQRRRELLFIALPAGVYLFAAMQTDIASGIRHLMPLLPLLLILAAAGSIQVARRVRWVRYAVPCLLVFHAASSLHASPNYLSYANELFGGPANAYKYLPWVDFGGALKQVKTYLDQHPNEPCWLGTTFIIDAKYYGVPCRQFGGYYSDPIPPRIDGLVILSSSFLSSANGGRGGVLENFAHLKPKDRIAGSAMLVYEGSFDTTLESGFSELLASRLAMAEGRFKDAMIHARRSTEITPERSDAHFQYCRALVANGMIDQAAIQCRVARTLPDEGKQELLRPEDWVKARQIAAGIIEADEARHDLNDGDTKSALAHAQKAVQLAPGSGTAHFEYCRALTASGQYELASRECSNAQLFMTRGRGGPLKSFDWDRLDEINAILHSTNVSPAGSAGTVP